MSPSESILVSHRQICHLISTGWRDFWQDSRNQGLNPGEAASPDSFFPSFRPAVAQLTNRGNGKVVFYEKKITHSKSDESLPIAARFAAHSTRPCLLCAFTGGASGLPRRLLNERQHRPR